MFTEIDATNTRALWMLPPEALDPSEFGPLNHRIDIYRCGLLFLHLAHGSELRFSQADIKAGVPKDLAVQLPSPFSVALEKALRRHAPFRTSTAMELWQDLNLPTQQVASPPLQLEFEKGNDEEIVG